MANIVYKTESGDERDIYIGPDNPAVTIGRAKDCEIRTNKKSVSRRHAEFRYDNGAYEVVDLDSSNGTWIIVDDQRHPVSSREYLTNYDEVWCGDFILHFYQEEEQETQDVSSSSAPDVDDLELGTEEDMVQQDTQEPDTAEPEAARGPTVGADYEDELEVGGDLERGEDDDQSAQIQALQDTLDSVKEERDELERELEAVRERNDELSRELDEEIEHGEQLQNELEQLQQKLESASDDSEKVEKLEAELDEARTERDELEQQLEKLESKADSTTTTMEVPESAEVEGYEELVEQINELEQQVEQLESERDELAEKLENQPSEGTDASAPDIDAEELKANVEGLIRVIDAVDRMDLEPLSTVDRIRLESALKETEPNELLSKIIALVE